MLKLSDFLNTLYILVDAKKAKEEESSKIDCLHEEVEVIPFDNLLGAYFYKDDINSFLYLANDISKYQKANEDNMDTLKAHFKNISEQSTNYPYFDLDKDRIEFQSFYSESDYPEDYISYVIDFTKEAILKLDAKQRKVFLITFDNDNDFEENLYYYLLDESDIILNEKIFVGRTLVQELIELWKFQLINKDDIKINNELFVINKNDFDDFVKKISNLIDDDINIFNKVKNVTLREFIDFYFEVQNKELTQNTKNIQTLINNDKVNAGDVVKRHNHYNDLAKGFTLLKHKDDEVQKILDGFKRDKEFCSKYKINNVYCIDTKDERQLDKYKDHISGIHGTTLTSITSILLNNVKTSSELMSLNADFKYTGSLLGDGVYFADPKQPIKTAFYWRDEAKNNYYMFYADIAYNKDSLCEVDSRGASVNGVSMKKASLIRAKHFGRRSLTEIVTPISDNVKLKYLFEFKRK